MSIKCLLLETKDKKKYFTLVGNSKHLKEYCRTFGAKMMVVKAELEKSNVLDLDKLVPALCDKNHENVKAEFEVLKKL